MKIIKVSVKNFRNLHKLEVILNPEINFVVGENDTGKSNFLDMLEAIMNNRRFSEGDFFNTENPIEVEFVLSLNNIEKGAFEDFFSPDSNDQIQIIAKQEDPEEYIKYRHKDTEEKISYTKLRRVNFIKYDSLRTPKEELTFYKNRGVGKFLGYLIERLLHPNEEDIGDKYIQKDNINFLVEDINEKLEKIRMFKEYRINATLEENIRDLLFKIITIKDSKGFNIQNTGHGVQFSILIVLSILEKLMVLIEDKKYEDCIFGEETNRSISLILGMDEPEIHLHPYMQRSLVKYVSKLLRNKEKDFSILIKELFNVDNIIGQAIIVSHSPNILLDNYKYIVRFYPEGTEIKAVSGENLAIEEGVEKHLLMNFPYIKEAMFSRCVVIVEGHSEAGALPPWITKEIGDIDEYGITVIQAGGGQSIHPIVKLLNELKITNVSIVDRDIYEKSKANYDLIENLYVTDKEDFESTLVESLLSADKKDVLFRLVEEFSDQGLSYSIYNQKLMNIATKYTIDITWDNSKDYKFNEIENINNDNLTKTMFLSWLDIRKSIVLGRFIGNEVEKQNIPKSYVDAINKAKEKTK